MTGGFEVIRGETELEIWVEKGFRVAEVEEILVGCVVKDVCSGAFVVTGFLEGGDLVVVLGRGVAGVEVWVSTVRVVGNVELRGLAVVLFGVSSKSASGKLKKSFTF